MRCQECHSYIPEGLAEPVICPNCEKPAFQAKASPTPAAATTLPTSPPPLPPPLPAEARPPELPSGPFHEPAFSTSGTPQDPRERLGLGDPRPEPSVPAKPEAPAEPTSKAPGSEAGAKAFAPFFTIRTRLVFGPTQGARGSQVAADGSLSFGADGFSIVSDGGRRWERISYREITDVRAVNDAVTLTVRDVESRLALHHSWLPDWIIGPRKRKAAVFVELLARVRSGLTPYEIKLYQRSLS